MPRFSLVIPTLKRPDTLRHALATLVRQQHHDYEIIVQNNGRDPATETVVEEFHNDRIRHHFSNEILPMPENWEAALSKANGDFITFIGDDDGLFADACRIATNIIDENNCEVVSWIPYTYYWPNCSIDGRRNRIHANIDYRVRAEIVSAKDELDSLYHYEMPFSHLPSIYYAFVRRTVVERAIKSEGRYFIGLSPDVVSGIINLSHVSQFVRLSRPLSLIGISGHSTGTNAFVGDGSLLSAEQFKRDFGTLVNDDRVAMARNLNLYLTMDMLNIADKRSLSERGIHLDFRRLLEKLSDSINDHPQMYDETLAAIQRMAAKHGVDLADLSIPERSSGAKPAAAPGGARSTGPGKVTFDISGDAAGLSNIADAVKLLEQIMPSLAEGDRIEIRRPHLIREGESVAFGEGGAGVDALVSGWGRPVPWGVWSIGRHASLRFSLDAKTTLPAVFTLRYRAFLKAETSELRIRCRSNGLDLAEWTITAPGSFERALIVPPEARKPDGSIEFKFDIAHRRSAGNPATPTDPRPASIGLEALTVSPRDTSKPESKLRRALARVLASAKSRPSGTTPSSGR